MILKESCKFFEKKLDGRLEELVGKETKAGANHR